jgi:hypothetical protein
MKNPNDISKKTDRKPQNTHERDSKELSENQEYEIYEPLIDRSRDISPKNDKAK